MFVGLIAIILKAYLGFVFKLTLLLAICHCSYLATVFFFLLFITETKLERVEQPQSKLPRKQRLYLNNKNQTRFSNIIWLRFFFLQWVEACDIIISMFLNMWCMHTNMPQSSLVRSCKYSSREQLTSCYHDNAWYLYLGKEKLPHSFGF